MTRWEFAQIANPGSGTDAVVFSHVQRESIVQEWKSALDRGLKAENSNRSFLHLNLNHTITVVVAGMLGAEGWDLVSHSVLTGGHEYYTFKRALPE